MVIAKALLLALGKSIVKIIEHGTQGLGAHTYNPDDGQLFDLLTRLQSHTLLNAPQELARHQPRPARTSRDRLVVSIKLMLRIAVLSLV